MAVAFSHAGSGSVKAGTTASATVTINANDTVVVAISIHGTTSPSSVSDTGGSVYTLKRAINNGTTDRIEFWSTAASAAKASTSVTVRFAASTTYVVSAATYTGVTNLAIYSASGAGANTGSNVAPNISTPTQEVNNWTVMGVAGVGVSTFSATLPNNLRTSAVTAGGSASTNQGGAIFDAGAFSEVGLNAVTGTLSAAETWAVAGIELRGSSGPNYSYLCGFEFDSLGEFNAVTGSPTIQSTTVHGGSFAMQCNTTAATAFVTFKKTVSPAAATVQIQTIFCSVRFYMFINTLPNVQTNIYSGSFEGASFFQSILLNTSGTLTIQDGAGVTATTSSALSTGAWHQISLEVNPSDGSNAIHLYVDGTLSATINSTTGNTADYDTAFLGVGINSTAATCNILFDDVLWASDDVIIGAGQQVLLLPTADSAIGNWTAGAGGVTNLWQGVDNVPPVGKAPGSETNTTQIRNATSAQSDYTATFQSYTTKGVPVGSTINAVVAGTADGNEPNTVQTTGTVWVASNPTQTPLAFPYLFVYGSAVQGTYPTGWNTDEGQVATNPVVTLSTAPTASLRKSATGTNTVDSCLFGIYVDYLAPVAAKLVWNMPFLPGFGNGR